MRNLEAVQISSCYEYISIVYFNENLTKIEAVIIYGMCTHDHPEGIWDFPVVLQIHILNEFYIAPIQCLCMQVDYSDVTAIENNLHKPQCIIGLAWTRKYNTLCKIYIYTVQCKTLTVEKSDRI